MNRINASSAASPRQTRSASIAEFRIAERESSTYLMISVASCTRSCVRPNRPKHKVETLFHVQPFSLFKQVH